MIDQNLAWFLTLSSFSITTVLYPAGQLSVLLLLFPLIPIHFFTMPGRNPFLKRTVYPIGCAVIIAVCFSIMKIKNASFFFCGVPLDCITSITGRAIYDSSFTNSDNNFVTLFINEVETIYGQTISAKGLVNVVSDNRAIITSGVKIKYFGKFTEQFFKATELQVLSRSRINDIREFLISEVEKRILIQSDSATYLSTMLLLGRVEDSAGTFKQAAAACGCTHVLALSGMHLHTFSLLFKPLKKKKLRYVLTVLASCVFVFIAGPRPSLVRALLMLVFGFLPIEERLLVCYIIQLIILPFSMINTGCIYSYLSIFAITFIVPVLNQLLPVLRPLVTSASVIFMIAPLELVTIQAWHPIAILIGPVAGFLISISMMVGLLLLSFGPLTILSKANNFVYSLLEGLFVKFADIPACGWKTYLAFASGFILILLYIPLKKHLLSHRFKKFGKNLIIKI